MSDHDGIREPGYRPTADELPDELDAPAPPVTVEIGGWRFTVVECRAGCGRHVPPHRGICDDCYDLMSEQR